MVDCRTLCIVMCCAGCNTSTSRPNILPNLSTRPAILLGGGHNGVPYIYISIKSTQIGWGNILPNDDMDKVGATMK